MTYAKPELLLVGNATEVVLGIVPGDLDNPQEGDPLEGVAFGLDA